MICAVCFGDPSSPLTYGAAWGIGTLLAVLVLVLLSFGMFFINVYKRSRRSIC